MKKKRGRKPKNAVTAPAAVASGEDEADDGENKKGKGSPVAKEPPTAAPTPAAATAWRQPPSSSSFQQYRRAGDMGEMTSVVIESLNFIVRRKQYEVCAQSLPLTLRCTKYRVRTGKCQKVGMARRVSQRRS